MSRCLPEQGRGMEAIGGEEFSGVDRMTSGRGNED